ncbi:hypothetical protein [Natronobacterium texcoconense]|uniref:Uncharacterized protein n=1 Tax=Natronobacterium texcoconense TaxID=1095778 RepID=A0A1H1CHM7_NATTX|nr:hypothetical protein [Natronobacterium texcoconense]SDQ63674.1 hypothetical protein SAMN04489842_1409 [Natronobacterium texcoconense]
MYRRTLLGTVGTAGVAGCLTSDTEGSDDDVSDGHNESSGDAGDSPDNGIDGRDSDSDDEDGREPPKTDEEFETPDPDFETIHKIGEAEPIAIEAKPDREYEYIEAEETVRIQDSRGETRELSFDEWGTRQALSAAESHVISLLEDEDVGSMIDVGIGGPGLSEVSNKDVDESDFDREGESSIVVSHTTLYTQTGEKHDEPAIGFEYLVELIPTKIEVTMLFDEREYTAVLPVLCHREWAQPH